MQDISNSAFEGSLYDTSIQSLTLVIWGACQTLGGPSFEPLISKASEQSFFDGKEPPEGIFHHSLQKTRSRGSCLGSLLIVGDVAQCVRCGTGAPFQAVVSGRRRGVGGGWLMRQRYSAAAHVG